MTKTSKKPPDWATKEWFDTYWRTGTTLPTASSRLRGYGTTIDWIAANNINEIVDIGCGDAQFYGLLKLIGWSGKYTGFDLSDTAIERAKALYPEATLTQADLETLDLTNTPGAIVSHFVYGWVRDVNAALKQLPPGRLAAITVRVLPHSNFAGMSILDLRQVFEPYLRIDDWDVTAWQHRDVTVPMYTLTGQTLDR